MNIALTTQLDNTDFETAVARTKAASSEQGFGVLTEIDMQATLKAKLGEDMESYLILGACNPTLAHRAVGVMPQIMVEVTGEPELASVANEATAKLRAAINTLGGRTTESV